MCGMWRRKQYNLKGNYKFFLIASTHDNLINMLSINFAMMQNFNYTLTDLEGMFPWERRVYIDLLMQHLKEEKEKMESMKQ
jgi:hypothetical protein